MIVTSISKQGGRDINEDSIGKAKAKGIVCVVIADGLGGHNGGKIASETAVNTVIDSFLKSPGFSKEHLKQYIESANEKIVSIAKDDPQLIHMSSTVVVLLVKGRKAIWANVGDSRLYLVNEGIQQITIDHSYVEEMVRMGGLDREQARNHKNKNIITRAIGAQSAVNPDFFEVNLKKGDRIFMCTDGVSNMLTDEEILSILNDEGTEEERIDRIVEAANEHGGRDNMGIIWVDPQL